jgi:hypothetical protein
MKKLRLRINPDVVFKTTENTTIFVNVRNGDAARICGLLNSLFRKKILICLGAHADHLTFNYSLDVETKAVVEFLRARKILVICKSKPT